MKIQMMQFLFFVSLTMLSASLSSAEELAVINSSQTTVDQLGPFDSGVKWNFNFGRSEFEKGEAYSTDRATAKGLTLEVQRQIFQRFYLGLSYTEFKVEQFSPYTYQGDGYLQSLPSVNNFTLRTVSGSVEARPIEIALSNSVGFFAGIRVGIIYPFSMNLIPWNYDYGIGAGLNFKNKLGIRADIHSNPDMKTYSSLALVGYY